MAKVGGGATNSVPDVEYQSGKHVCELGVCSKWHNRHIGMACSCVENTCARAKTCPDYTTRKNMQQSQMVFRKLCFKRHAIW